jgi:NCS1 family nucleobase:cation symporter-1
MLGVLPNMPGFLNAAFPASFPFVAAGFKVVYTYAWFVGVAIAALVYGVMMKGKVIPVLQPVVFGGKRGVHR